MPKKVLIVNFHSSCNAGDAILLKNAVDLVREVLPDVIISVMANYPEEKIFMDLHVKGIPSVGHLLHSGKGTHKVISICRFIIFALLVFLYPSDRVVKSPILPQVYKNTFAAYQWTDIVIGCPGNQLFTMGKWGWPFLISAMSIWIGIRFRKPLYIFPQSIGPFSRKWEWLIVKYMYRKARLVFVRDTSSYKIAINMNFDINRLYLIPDLGFKSLHDGPNNQSILDKLPNDESRINRGKVGVTVISRMTRSLDPFEMNRYYHCLQQALINLIIDYGVDIYFFIQVSGPTIDEDDRIATKKLVEGMKTFHDHIITIYEVHSAPELIHLYRNMDIFIASRLHSAILAISSEVPSFCIGYLSKTKGVMDTLGLTEWVLDFKEINERSLSEAIGTFWETQKKNRNYLHEILPHIRKQIDESARLLQQDLLYG
ncbi:MAG: polysaccharide pyruvyl transferase family protein [Anaerolineaceae bacterium]|nr:polysaccharide pyruvyl transferase family protein [Anaerolineaceae bacterium]